MAGKGGGAEKDAETQERGTEARWWRRRQQRRGDMGTVEWVDECEDKRREVQLGIHETAKSGRRSGREGRRCHGGPAALGAHKRRAPGTLVLGAREGAVIYFPAFAVSSTW